MATYVLEREQVIQRPRHEVFTFFSDAGNLERITPAFLRFSILTPRPIAMGPGTRIEYRLSLFGAPLRWRTIISDFTPETRFVDEQERGPYQRWVHTHTFEEIPEGTRMRDRVEYEPPLGLLGRLANRVFVARTLARVFDFRRDAIAEIFAR